MEDSSQNPYIPQEAEQIRQKVYQQQSPLGRVVKWSLIATVIIAVLVGVGLFFVIPRTTAIDEQARIKLADTLQPPEQVLKQVPVVSNLGFKLNYDNRVYSSYAEVGDGSSGSDSSVAVLSGETYENNELRVLRDYNYVRIRPIESVEGARALATQPPELELFATVTASDLEAAAKAKENADLPKLSLFVKLDTDKRLAKRVADDNTIVTVEATKPASTTINGVDYQKVRFTTTNDNYRIANVKYDDCYYTIQNDVPYSICVSNVRPASVSAASLVEQVFDSIAYEQPVMNEAQRVDSEKTSYSLPLARLAQADMTESLSSEETGEAPLITLTPPYYADENSLKSIAKNQPNVVRIGTLYCANLALRLEDGSTATTLSDACVGSAASGVFVSSDGYIATTGHAIRANKKDAITGYINFAPNQREMLERLQRVLDYLLKAKIILQSDAEYIKTGAQIGDQEALAKVENIASVIPDNYIAAVNEEYSYAVQPTDRPIVVNRSDSNKPSFAYSDSVINAKYVASEYDSTKARQEVFGSETPTADVGLLKAEGTFPYISISQSENVKSNDTLNTIGYSAYTDSSLTIDKIRDFPVVTVSKVSQAYEKDGTRLIQTNLPVLPGNDGAPVVDGSGKLIGFAVYGLSYCPDQNCFANGTVRSSGELTRLLNTSNIRLATESESALSWRSGVDQYFRANYAASTSAFEAAGTTYSLNRWAEPLAALSSANQGNSKDTSLMNQLQMVMIIALIIALILTVLLFIIFLLHRRRLNSMQVGHYGANTTPPQTSLRQPVRSSVQPTDTTVATTPPYQSQAMQHGSVQAGPPAIQQVQPPLQPMPGSAPQQAAPPHQPSLNEPTRQPEDPFYK